MTIDPQADEAEVSWLQAADFLLRSVRLVVILGGLGAIAAGATALFLPATYTVSTTFYPAVPNSDLSALSSLASQFGVGSAAVNPQSTPDFFAALLQSDPVLHAVVADDYKIPAGRDTLAGSLIKIWEIDEPSYGKGLVEATKELQDAMDVSTEATTGVVHLNVQSKWPGLSLAISTNLIQQLDSVDQTAYTAGAEQERRFIEGRLHAVESELHLAEDSLEHFLNANRDYTNDPRLLVRYQRIQRAIELSSAAYGALNQSYEQARIEAARNTPAITLLVPPTPPVAEDERHVGLKALLGALLGGILGLFVSALRDFIRKERLEHPAAFADLGQRLRAIWSSPRARRHEEATHR